MRCGVDDAMQARASVDTGALITYISRAKSVGMMSSLRRKIYSWEGGAVCTVGTLGEQGNLTSCVIRVYDRWLRLL